MKKCIYCGAELAEDDNFCYECGKSVGNNNTINEYVVIRDVDKKISKSSKNNYLIICVISILLIAGGWYLWNSKKNGNNIYREVIVNEPNKVKSYEDKINKVDIASSKEKEKEEVLNNNISINMSLSGKVGGEAEMEMQGDSGWYYMTYKGADPTKRTLELESYNSSDGQCIINAYLKGKYIGKFVGRITKENDSKTIQTYEGIFESVKGAKLDFYFHSY